MGEYLSKGFTNLDTEEERLSIKEMSKQFSVADEENKYLFSLDFFANVFMATENYSLSVFLMYTSDERCLVKAYQNDTESTFISTVYDNPQEALKSILEEFYDPTEENLGEDFSTRIYKNELGTLTLELLFEDGTSRYYTLQEIDRFNRVYDFEYKLYSDKELSKEVGNNEQR